MIFFSMTIVMIFSSLSAFFARTTSRICAPTLGFCAATCVGAGDTSDFCGAGVSGSGTGSGSDTGVGSASCTVTSGVGAASVVSITASVTASVIASEISLIASGAQLARALQEEESVPQPAPPEVVLALIQAEWRADSLHRSCRKVYQMYTVWREFKTPYRISCAFLAKHIMRRISIRPFSSLGLFHQVLWDPRQPREPSLLPHEP